MHNLNILRGRFGTAWAVGSAVFLLCVGGIYADNNSGDDVRMTVDVMHADHNGGIKHHYHHLAGIAAYAYADVPLSLDHRPVDTLPEYVAKFATNANGILLDGPHYMTSNSTHVFVTDNNRNFVSIFYNNGTFAGILGSHGSGDGEFSNPRGLAYNGTHLIIADNANQRIQIFDSAGNYAGNFSTGSSQIQKIAVMSSNIFVMLPNSESIDIYDSSGNHLRTIGGYSSTVANGKFGNIGDIEAGPAHLYVSDLSHKDVQVFDSAGNYVGRFGGDGTADGEFKYPISMLYSNAHLFVMDSTRHDIQIFDSAGNYVHKFGAEGTGDGMFTSPHDMAANSTHLFVVDTGRDDVQIFSNLGLRTVAPSYVDGFDVVYPGRLHSHSEPLYIVSNSTHLFVNDNNYVNTAIFHNNGTFVSNFADRGSGNGELAFPKGMAYNGTHLLVADSGNKRIQIFDSAGNYVEQFPTGSANLDVVTLSSNTFVTKSGYMPVEIYNSSGQKIGSFGGSSGGDGRFTSMTDIVAGTSHLYVSDRGNKNILIFDSAGNYVGKFGSEGTGDGEFQNPFAMLYASGYLFVADLARDDIQMFDSAGNYVGKFESKGTGDGEFGHIYGIASNSTHMFVLDNGNKKIHVFSIFEALETTANSPPQLNTIGAQNVNEQTALTFIASATDADQGQTITYSIDGTSLGATINPSTGAFSWTPTESQGPGTYQVTITATDNGSPPRSDSDTVTVTVTEVNTPPVLAAIGSKSVTAGSALAITLSATDADLPANTLTYSDNATFGTLTGASFAWTPSTSDIGSHVVRFTVSDGTSGGFDHEDVTITVSAVPNAAPTLSSISAQTVDELQTLTFTASATDTAGQTITYSLSGQRPGATINPSTGVFSWTPTEQQGPDTHQVTITATDNGSPQMSDSETVTITVTEVNTPPVLAAIGPKSVTAGSALAITLSATDVDLPANTLTYSDNVTFGTLTGASFAWTPSTSDIGQHTVRFTVSDGASGGSDYEDVVITVSAVPNAAPTLSSISAQTVDELQTLTFTASATDTAGQTITYSIDGTSLGATINPTTGVFSWTPTEQQGPDTHQVTITATDNGSPQMSDSETVTITVTEVNTPPVLAAIGPKSVTAGSALAITLSATDVDLPANTLTYSDNVTFGTLTGASFAWTPSTSDIGQHTVRFTVSDGASGGSDHEDVVITVSAVPNAAPTLSSISAQTVDELQTLTFTASATDTAGQTITYSLSGQRPGATINPSTGVFQLDSYRTAGARHAPGYNHGN